MPAQNIQYQMAGESAEHRSTTLLQHQWHWSVLTGSTTSLGWTCRLYWYPNRSSSDSCRQANAHSVVLLGVTRIQSRPTCRGAVCDPSHWAQLHLIEHSGAPHAIWGVAGCRAGQVTGSSQAAGDQHHRHGLAVRQTQQDLLITDWGRWRNPSYSIMHPVRV